MSSVSSIRLVDVARELGVSHTTVSRVLNNKEGISFETRQKVMEAVKELGYTPKASAGVARSSRLAESPLSIGLILCNSLPQNANYSASFEMQMLHGIQEVASQGGNVHCRILYWKPFVAQEGLEGALRHMDTFDGVVIQGNSDRELVETLLKRGMTKIVLADHEHDGVPVDSVTSDNITGGMLAARYLISKGYTRLGWLGGPQWVSAWSKRFIGFHAELKQNGILLEDDDIRNAEDMELNGITRIMDEWISHGNIPPAIAMPGSHFAFVAERELLKRGKRVPEDVAMVCFDDDLFISLCMKKPTRIVTFPQQIGRKAIQRLMELLRSHGVADMPVKMQVPVKLIEE